MVPSRVISRVGVGVTVGAATPSGGTLKFSVLLSSCCKRWFECCASVERATAGILENLLENLDADLFSI